MSIEDNKALVLKACQYLSDRQLPSLFALIHMDGSWSIPYRSDMFAYGGFKDKTTFSAVLTQFLAGFTSFSFTVIGIVAEGDRVAVEARSEGVGPGTAVYKNVYNMIFTIKNGMLHTVREFFDPFEVAAYVAQCPK